VKFVIENVKEGNAVNLDLQQSKIHGKKSKTVQVIVWAWHVGFSNAQATSSFTESGLGIRRLAKEI